MLNDYSFITFIAWGKPLNDFNIAIFLFLPLINTLNHSSQRKLSPFPIFVYVFLVSSLIALNSFTFSIRFFIPIIAITAINVLFYFRLSVIDFSNSLYSLLEEFYQESFNVGRTHFLLKRMLKINNETTFIKRLGTIKRIVLFKINNSGSLQILISSKFIYSFKIDEEKLFKDFEKSETVHDISTELDGVIYKNNVFLRNAYESTQYVLLVTFDKHPFSLFFDIYLQKILKPLFSKITNAVHVEYRLQNENQKYFAELKKHLEDIDTAVNAIHFLNNKLSPITSYFSLLNFYETEAKDEIKPALLKLIGKEKKNAINSIHPIVEKMNQMAERATNPVMGVITAIKLRKLFTIIRTCFETNNVKYAFIIEWSVETLSLNVNSNTYLFDFAVQEIAINIAKHSKSECTIKFAYDNEGAPIIIFSNSVNVSGKLMIELNKTISEFNSLRMNEIMKRKSKGLKMIKQFLEQLDIAHKMSLDNDKINLTLTIMNTYENSNI
ncbi:hypothetical protein [Mucilaginibacter phyllosphaerae]|uniref:Uncharacterized protein n=1 Tax=Mucilaginibacter phyllosphaerae TaxID=1812349 RepID=A0A4Y8ACQ8_9SPHI|nr:hypothetical protein [Mucilaginibacter phyllosphaerae]MBB3969384.1 hypothetical protein [Mucilaginibacter phyllosphaerae]TEW65829.1 hypothetical protein E2R65_11870 [Mucilaginibacter phyllosphaerae]